MKRIKKWILGATISVALLALIGGCATSQPTKQAMVCPQCKMVSIERPPIPHSPDDYQPIREQVEVHECPGCQGSLTTFFKEGKLQHKCSVCEQMPFTCPFSHR